MASPQQRIVKVGDDIIAFPGDLEDDHVKRLIKSFREKKNQPKITEESEHARQLKPAQPVSTAIPKGPDWVTTPLSTTVQSFEEKHPNLYGLDLKRQKQEEQVASQFRAAHPVAGGVVQGANQFAEGMTSPANMALMLGAPESKILSGIFATQAMRGSYSDAKAAQKAFEEGKNGEAAQFVTKALLGMGAAGLAGAHAYKGLPEALRGKLASEEGTLSLPSGKQSRTYEDVQKDIDKREEQFDKEKEPGVQYYFPEHAGLLRPNTYSGPEFTPEQLRGMELDSSGEQQIRDIVKEMKTGKSFKEAMESHGSISLADKLGGTLVRDENSVLPGYKPYPKDMVDLYAERDAIGSGQLKQSLGEITDKLKTSGLKDDAEIRHVLEYYALDPNKSGVGQQYLASQYTQAMVDMPPKRQVEQAYSALAAERGIPMDDADDLWRDRQTTKDAIAAVKAIHSYFYPGTEINIKGVLPEPKSEPLSDMKRQAEELQHKFRSSGLSQ